MSTQVAKVTGCTGRLYNLNLDRVVHHSQPATLWNSQPQPVGRLGKV